MKLKSWFLVVFYISIYILWIIMAKISWYVIIKGNDEEKIYIHIIKLKAKSLA